MRLRLTLWYVGLLAAALLLVFAIPVYAVMGRSLAGNLDASLRQRVAQVLPNVEVANNSMRLRDQGTVENGSPAPAVLLSPRGTVVGGAASALPGAVLRRLRRELPTRGGPQLVTIGQTRLAIDSVDNNGVVGYVVVWQSTQSNDEALQVLAIVMAAAGIGTLVLAGFGGVVVARRALAPVAQITRTASGILATDLSPAGAGRAGAGRAGGASDHVQRHDRAAGVSGEAGEAIRGGRVARA